MKASWKQTPLEQSKDKRSADLKRAHEEIIQLKKSVALQKERIVRWQEEINSVHRRLLNADELQQKYEYLIHQEIMLPTADGFKYFDNAQELDNYIQDKIARSAYASNILRSMSGMTAQMNTTLNQIFETTYAEFKQEKTNGNTGSASQETHQENTQ